MNPAPIAFPSAAQRRLPPARTAVSQDVLRLGVIASERRHHLAGANRLFRTSGVVGTVRCSYSYRSGCSMRFRLRVRPGQPFVLLLKEIAPWFSPGLRSRYSVMVDGERIAGIDHVAHGFGPSACFIPVSFPARDSSVHVTLAGRFAISSVAALPARPAVVRSVVRQRPFRIVGLLDPGTAADIRFLQQTIQPAGHATAVMAGFASEIDYASWPLPAVEKRLNQALAVSRETGMPFLPIWSSWWSGTPLHVPDGLGGHFGDLRYQQICWSPTDTVDEPGLKKLLGNRWNLHYGLSVPNLWSNTPWLTMNSQRLNAYRRSRAALVGGWLKAALKLQRSAPLLGLVTENEPRYWDMDCPDRYPIHRADLEADFNPDTVAAAARDGVNLDPEHGLSPAARWWLHENIARYIQAAADNLRVTGIQAPVYTHNLTKPGYPMRQLGPYHPMMETCRVHGARVGIEELWQPDWPLYARLREWGRWACVNREEGDGQPLATHVALLQELYAAGADFVNSYNWQSIGRDRWRAMIRTFLTSLPVTTDLIRTAAGPHREGAFTLPRSTYGFTGVRVALSSGAARIVWTITAPDGTRLVDRVDARPADGLLDAGSWIAVAPGSRLRLHLTDAATGRPLRAQLVGLVQDFNAERARSIETASSG